MKEGTYLSSPEILAYLTDLVTGQASKEERTDFIGELLALPIDFMRDNDGQVHLVVVIQKDY